MIECAGGALLPGCTITISTFSPWPPPPDRSTCRATWTRPSGRPTRTPGPAYRHPGRALRRGARGPLGSLAPRRARPGAGGTGPAPLGCPLGPELGRPGCRSGAAEAGEAGIERDDRQRPTGRLFRLDGWLRARLPARLPPDLAAVGHRLASYGVTGVTDCTPAAVTDYFDPIAAAVRAGALPLTVAVTGGPELSEAHPPPPYGAGRSRSSSPTTPSPRSMRSARAIARAHRAGRPVAVHCVTRAALLLALAAWGEVGSVPGDRIEHASVTPLEAVPFLRELSLTVVTQPAFVAARGDGYLAEVEPADQPDLYRCASLQEGGVSVGGSTDAPFGPDDPWCAVRAAVERRAASGAPVGSDRGLDPASALDLFLGPPEHPGGPRRRVTPGAPADLCLLDVPLAVALRGPSSEHVVTTIAGGRADLRGVRDAGGAGAATAPGRRRRSAVAAGVWACRESRPGAPIEAGHRVDADRACSTVEAIVWRGVDVAAVAGTTAEGEAVDGK